MKNPRAWWLVLVAIIIVLCYVVPYTLLSEVDEWYGSFLFWTLATAVVVGVNAIVSSAWRD
ncbi:hypothetical protein MU582_21435 [Nocardioidaceae bacterium SCSIO 66511]|nr:hypothetical protein MU582_21435 [Nocardioidaceae bacterium SCSIO 66511]